MQPFRYLGYVFDEETGLYYLRSRYYNPQWGRFVNADCILDNCNIFLYCSNQAPCSVDYDGFRQDEDADTKPWKFRIDKDHGKLIGPGEWLPHLHLENKRNSEKFSINADGSMHHGVKEKMTCEKLKLIRKDKKIREKWPPRDGDGKVMFKEVWEGLGWKDDDFVSNCEVGIALPQYNSFPLDTIALMSAPTPTVGTFDFSLAEGAASLYTSVKSSAGSFFQSLNNTCGISDLFRRKQYTLDIP